MDVRLIQVAVSDEEPAAARLDRVCALVAAQAGADLVVLPELWTVGAWALQSWTDAAEPVGGPFTLALADAARAAGCLLHAGSFLEATGHGPQGPTGHGQRGRANTSLLISAAGEVLATYRKMHRFGFDAGEPALIDAGTALVVTSTEAGALGLATCYDLRFPELFRGLLDAGAELFAVPAAWPAARIEAWTVLGRARAIENQCFVLACNAAGSSAGVALGGRSQVVHPSGQVLGVAGEDEAVLRVEIDLVELARTRKVFPVLRDRVL